MLRPYGPSHPTPRGGGSHGDRRWFGERLSLGQEFEKAGGLREPELEHRTCEASGKPSTVLLQRLPVLSARGRSQRRYTYWANGEITGKSAKNLARWDSNRIRQHYQE